MRIINSFIRCTQLELYPHMFLHIKQKQIRYYKLFFNIFAKIVYSHPPEKMGFFIILKKHGIDITLSKFSYSLKRRIQGESQGARSSSPLPIFSYIKSFAQAKNTKTQHK